MTRRSAVRPSQAANVSSAKAATAALETLRDRLSSIAYPLVVLVAVVMVALGQYGEDLTDNSANHLLTSPLALRRWAIIALVLYELVIARLVETTVRHSLSLLRPVVRIDGPTFAAYERRMNGLNIRVELLVLLAAALICALLFLVLGVEPLADDPFSTQSVHMPAEPLGAALVLSGYIVLGWAGGRLLALTIRLGRELGRLSRESLNINVFDTVNVLPFGNIALAVALAPAGIIAILLIGLGAPSSVIGWTALVLATVASVLALLLPLRGIHDQMYAAKDQALEMLNTRITDIYDEVAAAPLTQPDRVTRISQVAGAILPLRKTVQEMTTWPFRDTVALARALLIASAPLIYTTLSEFIKILLGR